MPAKVRGVSSRFRNEAPPRQAAESVAMQNVVAEGATLNPFTEGTIAAQSVNTPGVVLGRSGA
jgi:hypothetical protein